MARTLILGDAHGNASWMCNALTLLRDDYDLAIQVGDFGFYWYGQDNTAPLVEAIALTGKPLWFIDGNHEYFPLLPRRDSPDKVEMHPGLFYLPRGHTWEMGGRKFLAVGGGTSVDKMFRKIGQDYFYDEAITDEDVARCALAGKVDVLLCHDTPNNKYMDARLSASKFLDFFPNGVEMAIESAKSRSQMDKIWQACDARLTVHGHMHHHYRWEQVPGREIVGLSLEGTPGSAAILDTETMTLETV